MSIAAIAPPGNLPVAAAPPATPQPPARPDPPVASRVQPAATPPAIGSNGELVKSYAAVLAYALLNYAPIPAAQMRSALPDDPAPTGITVDILA